MHFAFPMRMMGRGAALAALISAPLWAYAGEIASSGNRTATLEKKDRLPEPQLAPASTEGAANLKRIKVPEDLKLDLWAAEPMLGNMVTLCVDEQGRVFTGETYRYRSSVLDIRNYMFMLEDDLACRTVDDRIAMCKKWFGDKADDLKIETEVIRVLEDRNGSGHADFSAVYADHFNTMLDGVVAGVIARKGKVYVTNIPELWELDGMDKDGHALSRKSLSHGYGVRFSFTGHDMHGLIVGPDRKLYFSFGDRAANVKTKEGKSLAFPDEGAVFRCDLDGSNMEVVYRGLRNPQELAFDQYGNLFTGDNDFDHGDEERLVYLAEGGDSGWRIGYQHSPLGYDLVPWKSEHIWVSYDVRQSEYNGKKSRNNLQNTGIRSAAYLPPICNVANGPSGLMFNPGVVALPARYDNHFFLCSFVGDAANSKVQTFSVKPKGAGFALEESKPFIENIQPCDVAFGPDGSVYVTDWGGGWDRTGKGRIYRVYDSNLIQSEPVLATKKIIGEGMEKRSTDELVQLLSHRDMRVRQEAQFALVDRNALDQLTATAKGDKNQLARLHAIWGLGELGRKKGKVLEAVAPLLKDSDPEVRAQATKVLGEDRYGKAYAGIVEGLKDEAPRVQFMSAMALGKLGSKKALPVILELIRANDNKDAFIRHATMMALVGTASEKNLKDLATDSSPAVRMAAVLALRKLESPAIATYLKDQDPAIVIEAARAINDVPINKAMPELAKLINAKAPVASSLWGQPFYLRAINANYRSGEAKNVQALVQYASNNNSKAEARVEALHAVGTWAKPPQRDRVIGVYRPLQERSATDATKALQPALADLLHNGPESVRVATADAIGNLAMTESSPMLIDLIKDTNAPTEVRVASLKALATMKSDRLGDGVQAALRSGDQDLSAHANRLLAKVGGGEAVKQLAATLDKGTIAEKQGALAALGQIQNSDSQQILGRWVNQLVAGKVAPELQLDVIEAAGKTRSQEITDKLAQYKTASASSKDDTLAGFRESLNGGDTAGGKTIFYERADAQCLRCHKLNGDGSEVGPDLTGIGKRQSREYILESIVHPNNKIAPGYETVNITTKTDEEISGVLKSESADEVVLAQPGTGLVKVKKSNIASRKTGISGMPEGFAELLSKRDLRDLVQFLAGQK